MNNIVFGCGGKARVARLSIFYGFRMFLGFWHELDLFWHELSSEWHELSKRVNITEL
jgi:hypothetical protein